MEDNDDDDTVAVSVPVGRSRKTLAQRHQGGAVDSDVQSSATPSEPFHLQLRKRNFRTATYVMGDEGDDIVEASEDEDQVTTASESDLTTVCDSEEDPFVESDDDVVMVDEDGDEEFPDIDDLV